MNNTYCGYIKIIGKTNVGKSSLLNKIIGNKISIVSPKQGTTIDHIIGIKTTNQHQLIYIDTPGIIKNKKKVFFNNSIVNNQYIKLIVFVINKTHWSSTDEMILERTKKMFDSIILVINKIDCIHNKNVLLPFIDKVKKKYNFQEIIPVSAKTGENIDKLSEIIKNKMPINKHFFSNKNITTSSKIFTISEIIREKLFKYLNQEIPYSIKIKIILYKIDKSNIHKIHALILVKNIRHKKIIIGKNGNKIKQCSILSRQEIEKYLNKIITLKLWVKVTI